jgi:hypothetical protein
VCTEDRGEPWRAPAGKERLRDGLRAKVAAARARQRSWLTSERRPAQILPPLASEWLVWLILAGRGWGKTRTGAETVADWAREHPGCRIALIAITFADGRDTMVEGESGLLRSGPGRAARRVGRQPGTGRWGSCSSRTAPASRSTARAAPAAAWPAAPLRVGRRAGLLDRRAQGPGEGHDLVQPAVRAAAPGGAVWPADYAPRSSSPPLRSPSRCCGSPNRCWPGSRTKQACYSATTRWSPGHRTTDNLANLSRFKKVIVDPLMGTTLGRQELEARTPRRRRGRPGLARPLDRGRGLIGEVPHLLQTVVSRGPGRDRERHQRRDRHRGRRRRRHRRRLGR